MKNLPKIQTSTLATFKNNKSSQFWKNVKNRNKITKRIPPDIGQQKSPVDIDNHCSNL